MHSKGIAHCNLKPEVVLFDENFNLKIVHFELTAALDAI